jgi:hypothetical protein
LQGKRKLGILLDHEMEEDDESENMPILLPHGINQEVFQTRYVCIMVLIWHKIFIISKVY